jgi:hypothetical protein
VLATVDMPNWDEHKDTLWRLYVVEDKKRDDIIKIMRERYDFDAKYTQHLLQPFSTRVISNLTADQAKPVRSQIQKMGVS